MYQFQPHTYDIHQDKLIEKADRKVITLEYNFLVHRPSEHGGRYVEIPAGTTIETFVEKINE